MVKSANLYVRIETDLKEQAEAILSALGIPASNAITMFYKQVVLQNGLPFAVKLSQTAPIHIDALTDEQHRTRERIYGHYSRKNRSSKDVFADIRKDYNT